MSNPGLELHAIYSSWRMTIEQAPGKSMRDHLAIGTSEGVAQVRRAFALLNTMDELLRWFELQNMRTSPYRRQFDGWARVPLSVGSGWNSGVVPDHLITTSMLEEIESFGAYLEGKVLVMAPDQQESLRAVIDRADALLTSQELDPRLASYLRRLIAAIRYALDDEVAGRVFDFSTAIQNLWVAFNAAAERAPEPAKSGWRNLAEQIMVGVASAGVVEGAVISIHALTTGG